MLIDDKGGKPEGKNPIIGQRPIIAFGNSDGDQQMTADGTEHTIKYTDQTAVKGAKETGKGVEKGSVDTYLGAKVGTKVTVNYTEKTGEKLRPKQ